MKTTSDKNVTDKVDSRASAVALGSARLTARLEPQSDASGLFKLTISAEKVDAEGQLSPSRTEPRGIAMAPAVTFMQRAESATVCDKCGKPFPPISDDIPDDVREMLKTVTTCTECLIKASSPNGSDHPRGT